MACESGVAKAEDGPACDASRVWLPEIITRVAAYLSDNEVACGLRLTDRTAAALLKGHTRVRLSQPCPPGAFAERWSRPGSCRDFTLKQRRRLLCLTAASGVVENLEVALAAAGCLPTPEVLDSAAGGGHVGLCQWLTERHGPALAVGSGTLVAAAAGGSREACEWCLAAGVWTEAAPQAAARCGHERLLDWLMGQRPASKHASPADECCLMAAVAEGLSLKALRRHLALAQHSSGQAAAPLRYPERLLAGAAASPTPDWRDKLAFVEAAVPGAQPMRSICNKAARRPDAVERLQWLWSHGFLRNCQEAIDAACAAGDAAALSWHLGWGYKPGREAALLAAEGGHVEVLQALHAAGELAGHQVEAAAHAAAEAGQLEAVTWLVDHLLVMPAASGARRGQPGAGAGSGAARAAEGDMPLGPTLLRYAARSGSVPLMALVRARGCEWDEGAVFCAAEAGCEAALEWMKEDGAPWIRSSDDPSPYAACLHQGDTGTFAVLQRLGLPFHRRDFLAVVRRGLQGTCDIRALRWLGSAVRVQATWAAAAKAERLQERERTGGAQEGEDEVVAWLGELAKGPSRTKAG